MVKSGFERKRGVSHLLLHCSCVDPSLKRYSFTVYALIEFVMFTCGCWQYCYSSVKITVRIVVTTRPYIGKVKCTFVQALRLCTGRTAHRGSRGIALLFSGHGTRRWWGVGVTPRPLFTPEKDPVPIVQEAGWDPGPVWTGAESLAPTGIRSSDRPARSHSLYRLCYPASVLHRP
jgi:hypothetical protein